MIAGIASSAVDSPTVAASTNASFAEVVEMPAVELDQESRSWNEKDGSYGRSYTKVQGLGLLFKDNLGHEEVIDIEDRVCLFFKTQVC